MGRTGEGWIQADPGPRPMQAVVLPGEQRETRLNGQPADVHYDFRQSARFMDDARALTGYVVEVF
jgi:hypothetical protein